MRDDHHGLAHDLQVLHRRQMLRLGAGVGVLTILGCKDNGSQADASTTTSPTTDATTTDATSASPTGDLTCAIIPAETAGPYPGDGSNGANALALTGIVRSDIRSSIAGANGTAQGVLLTVELTIVDSSCTPLADHAVYIWQCDRDSNYSMYSAATAEQNYLRGVQVSDSDGKLRFTTIFPGCYPGRWPHIHFEVYPDLEATAAASNKLRTSQLALTKAACELVFATPGYDASVPNLAEVSLATDGVFADGAELQLAELSGSVSDGYTARLTIAV